MYSNIINNQKYIIIDLQKEYGCTSDCVDQELFAVVNLTELSDEEFQKHFEKDLETYSPFVVISADMYEAMRESSCNDERERKREALYHDHQALELAEVVLIDELSNPVSICESLEIITLLLDRMLALPDNQGSRMYKRYVLGFSTKEIANQEGVTAETVQKCLLKARNTIKCVFRELGVINYD